jgi:type IV pilus assembly protein PilQ
MSSKKQYLGTKAVGKTKESIGKSLILTVGGLLVTLLSGAVHATATIQNVEFSSRPGSKFEIRLDFDQPPPDKKANTIEKPARIAIDFQDTKSAL